MIDAGGDKLAGGAQNAENFRMPGTEKIKDKAEAGSAERSKAVIKEISELNPGDAKISFLLNNNNENWNTILSFGLKKASEIINLFLSKLDSGEKTPDKLSDLMKLPATSSFLVFGFILEQARDSQDPKYISETLKKGFKADGKPLPALMLANIMFEQFGSRLTSDQNIELIVDIMQGQAEGGALNTLVFSGLVKSLNKNILRRMNSRASTRLLFEMTSRMKKAKLNFDSFPMDDLVSRVDVNEIKQFNAEQILIISKSDMTLDQKEVILNKFFTGEDEKSISSRWNAQNHSQLFKNLLGKHPFDFLKVFDLKKKTESRQKQEWTDLFSSVARVANYGISMRRAALGST